jgi:Spy/CpxP family protein refolding chaperone
MEKLNVRNVMAVLTVVALVGIGATAFAGWGRGYGRHMGWGGGPADGPGYGRGYLDENLTDEQIKAIEDERQAFFNETESLRETLYAKELELRAELAKENPDAQKAAEIQKEISRIESDLDQKRVVHMIKMRQINPDAGKGYARGYGRGSQRGYGMGPRGAMGYGPGDCPGYGRGDGSGNGRGGGCWR